MLTRRNILLSGAASLATGGLLNAAPTGDAPRAATTTPSQFSSRTTVDGKEYSPGEPGKDYTPVVYPNGSTLPFKVVDGWKVFHLTAEPCKREFAPGLVVDCWGYNGETPGPLIEAVEGDRVRIYVTNKLPAPTTVHWHGVLLPNGMDGVGSLTQKPIPVGKTFKYEFTLRQHGTAMYHPHFDEMTQIAMGMMGMFVIHPRVAEGEKPARPDRDFAIILGEWLIHAGTSRPDVNAMSDFNVLTMNSKTFPGTDPLVVKKGQHVRVRFGNLGPMDHHPIHLHGYQFHVTATDGGPIPPAAQHPATTVLVSVGTTRNIEFIADAPGDWAFHCHMVHHMMNQMGHGASNMTGIDSDGLDDRVQKILPDYMTMGVEGMGGMGKHIQMGHMKVPPNSIPMVGTKGPFGYIDMGGMFTILKVREGIESYEDPGWYEHPEGTVAVEARDEDLERDGVERS